MIVMGTDDDRLIAGRSLARQDRDHVLRMGQDSPDLGAAGGPPAGQVAALGLRLVGDLGLDGRPGLFRRRRGSPVRARCDGRRARQPLVRKVIAPGPEPQQVVVLRFGCTEFGLGSAEDHRSRTVLVGIGHLAAAGHAAGRGGRPLPDSLVCGRPRSTITAFPTTSTPA